MLKRRTFLGSALGAAAVSAVPRFAGAHIMTNFKLYDTHAHFYTDDFKNYPVDGRTNRNGPEELRQRVAADPKTPDRVLPQWEDCNIARGAAVQYGSAYSNDNRYVIDICKKYPDRLRAICILDENDPKTPATIERMTKQDKISGIRFRGFAPQGQKIHDFLSDNAAEIWQTANNLGIAIVLMPHTRVEDRPAILNRMGELAVKYPNVNVILDHMAFPQPVRGHRTFGFYPEHFELQKLDNVYYKYTSLLIEQMEGGHVPPDAFLQYATMIFGSKKMIWGSDYGNTAGRMIDLTHMALESAEGLSLEDKKALFFDTADKIHVAGGRGPKA